MRALRPVGMNALAVAPMARRSLFIAPTGALRAGSEAWYKQAQWL